MEAKREYRDREETEVTVLDALVDRHEEGMTVLELRSHADEEIDAIEAALSGLKADGLIDVERDGNRTRIYPDDRVIPEPGEGNHEPSFVDRIRQRIGL
jgi:DNA-binding transcriptional ArsR family regulator